MNCLQSMQVYQASQRFSLELYRSKGKTQNPKIHVMPLKMTKTVKYNNGQAFGFTRAFLQDECLKDI